MVFEQYEELKIKYAAAQKVYDAILTENEELFAKTQPKGVRFDRERVAGGKKRGGFDAYLAEKEKRHIDERLAAAKNILVDRQKLLEIKRFELEMSKNVKDRIYFLKIVKDQKIPVIAQLLGYSSSQTYRILREISDVCEKMRQNAKKTVLE